MAFMCWIHAEKLISLHKPSESAPSVGDPIVDGQNALKSGNLEVAISHFSSVLEAAENVDGICYPLIKKYALHDD